MSTDTTIPKVTTLEVIQTGSRRRWTAQEKLRIVGESLSGPRMLLPTARRYGLSSGQLYLWRRQAREGKLCGEDVEPGFVPAIVVPDARNDASAISAGHNRRATGRIEVVVAHGRRLIIEGDVNPLLVVEIVRGLEGLA